MRAIVMEAFGGADCLRPAALPDPTPETGEILIRTVSAGVNPEDWKVREGLFKEVRPHRFPLVPGWDVAGVVEALGPGVTRFRKGDKVWACARKPVEQWGCYAEKVTVPETQVAAMPAKLLFEEAAGVPVAGLSAMQALAALPGLGGRHRILIHGAAGGVGHFAVQLARNSGARVLACAAAEHQAFVADLGASVVIDPTTEDLAAAVMKHAPEGVDMILDTVGGSVLEGSYGLLKSGGVLVGLVDPPNRWKLVDESSTAVHLEVEASGNDLALLAQLADAHRLRPNLDKIYPLKAAADAQERLRTGSVRGKLVLNI